VIGRRTFGNYAVGLEARTIAMSPARIASGGLSQVDITRVNSEGSSTAPKGKVTRTLLSSLVLTRVAPIGRLIPHIFPARHLSEVGPFSHPQKCQGS
jgi:hypothetical protein